MDRGTGSEESWEDGVEDADLGPSRAPSVGRSWWQTAPSSGGLGDVLGDLPGLKTHAIEPVGSLPPEPGAVVTGAAAQLSLARAAIVSAGAGEVWRLGDAGLREAFGELGVIRSVVERMEVSLAAEVLTRGTATAAGFTPTDWIVAALGSWAPSPEVRHVSEVLAVATACQSTRPGGEDVAAAVASGLLPVGKAAQIARFTDQVKAVADPDALTETVRTLVEVARDDAAPDVRDDDNDGGDDGDLDDDDDPDGDEGLAAGDATDGDGDGDEGLAAGDAADGVAAGPRGRCRGLTSRELAVLVKRAVRVIRPVKDLEGLEERQRLGRGLVKSEGATGMATYRLTLDPEGAAVLDAAVAALSAPVKGLEGAPDPRSAPTRRADAVLTLVRRAVAAGQPGTDAEGRPIPPIPGLNDKAQLVVTLDYDVLRGSLHGAGVTMTGQVLSAATLRRMACDAGIVPMVLGGHGQALDVGRSRRFFTPAQRLAVWRRDGHCTFPDCTIPATWCEVHHAVWWSRGGPTDLLNAALLCQRHHSVVHDRDLHATVDDTGVRWHSTPR